jgi:pyruvate/2-oxoglutarate dehydrogenase complex dihydrolipoamide dehydrogenase (E3) component
MRALRNLRCYSAIFGSPLTVFSFESDEFPTPVEHRADSNPRNFQRWRNNEPIPEHLLILGGGYIGLEFGQMFRRYGSRVTVIHRGAQIVPSEDPEIAAELQKALEAEGLQFVLNARTEQVQQKNDASD